MVEISSRDYWFKVVEMLQQNWALIDVHLDSSATVFFIDDTSDVFDQMIFPSRDEAQNGLRINGFKLFSEDEKAQKFIAAPEAPFRDGEHRPIYSSGRFWK